MHKDIEKDNEEVNKLNESTKSDSGGVGLDETDWATDDHYFNRVFHKHSAAQVKSDGSNSDERVVNKEEGRSAVEEILLSKIDTSGDKKKAKENVDRLMKKYFADNWDYYDAANEGFIETSRAPQFIHKVINLIKMDDDEESLHWKSK